MNVIVMLSSGDLDEWNGVADATAVDGYLTVLADHDEDTPEDAKTVLLRTEVPQELAESPRNELDRVRMLHSEPVVVTKSFVVRAQYAPGMWMRVEFE